MRKHQPASVLRMGGPSIDKSLLIPLLIMAAGFALLFGWLVLLRMRSALNEKKARALSLYGQPAPRGEDSAAKLPSARPAWP